MNQEKKPDMPPPKATLLSLEETATRLKRTKNQVRGIAGSPMLPVHQGAKGELLFDDKDVEKLLKAGQRRQLLKGPALLILFLLLAAILTGGMWGMRWSRFRQSLEEGEKAAKAGDWKSAEIQGRMALLGRPDHPQALSLLAQALLKQRKIAEGYFLLRRLLQTGQADTNHRINLALSAKKLGHDLEARQVLKDLLREKPNHFYANYLLSQSDLEVGKSSIAYNRLLTLYKRNPSPLLAQTIRDLGSQTAQPVSPGITTGLPPEDPWLTAYREGRKAQMAGKPDVATRAYAKVLSHQRLMALTLNNQAILLMRQPGEEHNRREALELLQKAWILAPDEWAVADTLASLALRMKDKREALLWTQTALKNNPADTALAFYRRALALQLAGQPKEAGAFAAKSLKALQKGMSSEISEDGVKILIGSLEQEKNRLPLKGKKK